MLQLNNYLFGSLFLILIILLSLVAWKKLKSGSYTTALVFILLIAATLRIFVGSDPALHEWDEQYHALVAKNLAKHPLKPTLYDNPVLPYDPRDWVGNHVWLEKPPVALWGMATSISIFGANTWAVRLPSLLFGILSIVLTYRIGSILFEKRIGLFAAYLHAINGVIIELGGGKISSDHVETAFIFFTELAIFLTLYFSLKKPNYYITLLIGLTTGLAFLSKWYPAGIVLPVWLAGFILLRKGSFIELLKHGVILALSIMLVIAPWIYFINSEYPAESDFVLNKFLNAYSSSVENHNAPWYYYLHEIMAVFGELIYIVLAFSVYSIFRKKSHAQIFILLLWIAIPVIIFSFGETKRHTYLLIAAPAFFVLTGNLWFYIYDHVKIFQKKRVGYLVLAALLILPFRLMTERTKLFEPQTNDTELFYKNLTLYQKKLDKNDIVFGSDQRIRLMFFTDVGAAYAKLPSAKEVEELKAMRYTIYVMQNFELTEL